MRKLSFLVCIFIFSFLISCKSNEEPKPKPTTLADRAGTYTGTGTYATTMTLIINKNGIGTLQDGMDTPDNITIGSSDSTNTSFIFLINNDTRKDWTIDFATKTLIAPLLTYNRSVFSLKKID